MNAYLAVDFGGGSGRVMAGSIDQGVLKLEEVYRFPNRQVRMGNHVYWDFLALFDEMKNGLRQAVRKGYTVKSIGIDTWGVDFGLIDKDGNLLGNPVCYRDLRTEGLPDELFDEAALAEHYAEAGIQVMSINTLFQLYSMKKNDDVQLKVADRLLFMPDLFSYYLTGVANNEYCIASTSELLDARTRTWNRALIEKLGLPQHLFGDIVMPGTVRGRLKREIREEIGLPEEVEVIAVGSHDTASAVFAVPAAGKCRAFLSSGTWSLLGIETDEPILSEEARNGGFTNEGGVGGKIRFLQNITGLWMLQQLIRQWKERGEETDYEYLITAAERADIPSVVDVDDKAFQSPMDMEAAIADYCREHACQVPASQGEYVRCVLQSLAQRYKRGVEQLNRLLPSPVEQLHIVGGGCRNRLLNSLTAEALGIPVYAGPVEATAIGNILVQALVKGEIRERDEIKEII
ncbi:rhamnulokinase family protein [Bacteroides sp. GD17]|jgi:rhamnulokinase|uniref:rhamnulokinase n=1 Tax=Bacteroides sp. GD17 TaxID=3139826 RepID=UPI0025E5CD4D|nr:rhamnulokinase family protein [uncultured Bacteroides sp.]